MWIGQYKRQRTKNNDRNQPISHVTFIPNLACTSLKNLTVISTFIKTNPGLVRFSNNIHNSISIIIAIDRTPSRLCPRIRNLQALYQIMLVHGVINTEHALL